MKYLYFILIILLGVSCKSPTELMEKGKYNKAFKRAVRKIKKKKNVDQNITVLEKCARLKADEMLRRAQIEASSRDVEDWVKTQTSLYRILEEIGYANVLVKGQLSDSYDDLCGKKKDIDYQIVEHYFDKGHDFIDEYYYRGQKEDARNAFYNFEECEKHEGQLFFPFLMSDKKDAYEKGIVYYVSNIGGVGDYQFLKHLSNEDEIVPDCDIQIDFSQVWFSNSESSSTDSFSEKIKIGKEEVKDTSGRITYVPIYETVTATVTTVEVTVTAEIRVSVWTDDITGQCNVETREYNLSDSDSYKEISISGDVRAISCPPSETSGCVSSLESSLGSSLKFYAKRNIRLFTN